MAHTYEHLTFTLQDDKDVHVHIGFPGERDFVIPRKEWDDIVAAMSGRARAGTGHGADLEAPLSAPVGQHLGPDAGTPPIEKTIEETRAEAGFVENPQTDADRAKNEKAQAKVDAALEAEAKRRDAAEKKAADAARR